MDIATPLRKLSLWSSLLISAYILYFHFGIPRYTDPPMAHLFDWDVLSYHLYLPLTFIHKDIGVNDPLYIQHIFDQYHFSPAFYQADHAPNGNWVMVYTGGMAILYSPFFFIGHLWAQGSGYPADGFSFPYQFCISTGMYLYILAGIFYLRKVLLHFFNERIAALTLIIILLGTNYFREAVDYPLGPHAVLFSFYCALLYYTIRWHDQAKVKYAIAIGFCIGLLALIRPTEIIAVLIPLFWGIYDRQTFRNKWKYVLQHKTHLLMLVLTVLIVWTPQMIYWYRQTGHFLYNSYWNQNSFDISESHFLQVFFSIRKGWLVYTPLIALSLIGLLSLRKHARASALSAFIFLSLNIFLLTHVPVWFNAGSFGQRFMVQSYAVLAIPTGAVLQSLTNRMVWKKILVAAACTSLVCLNLFQTWQFVWWILPCDGMTWQYYKYAFFKTTLMTREEQKMLDLARTFDPNEKFDESNPDYRKRFLAFYDLENLTKSSFISEEHALSGKASNLVDSKNPYSVGYNMPFSAITDKDHLWMKFTAWYFSEYDLAKDPAELVVCMQHRNKPYWYMNYKLAGNNGKINQWNKITVHYLTPLLQDPDDVISAFVLYEGKKRLFVDNLTVEAFERK